MCLNAIINFEGNVKILNIRLNIKIISFKITVFLIKMTNPKNFVWNQTLNSPLINPRELIDQESKSVKLENKAIGACFKN